MRATGAKQRCILLLAAGLVAGGAAPEAGAQSAGRESASTQSRSGQFTAHVLYQAAPDPTLLTNLNLVRLDPAVVAVSCERIREILWRDLQIRGPWVSRISILLYPALTPDEAVTVASDRFKDGWQYELYIPQMVERRRYVRAITQVVLLELANRQGGIRAAEIPAWLVEGFSQRLLASSDAQIILASPESRGGRPIALPYTEVRGVDPLTHAHEAMSGHPLLTFQDLSWPNETQFSGEAGEVYRGSAHLLVSRLLKFPDGRAGLRAFLAGLPSYYNWQFAFLPAFHSHFERPLDVEKWWAIQAAEFTGRRLDQTWAEETSLQKLEQAIHTPIEVRTGADELPLHTEARLQNVVRDWSPATQDAVIQSKIVELNLLRPQVAPSLAPLVEEYRQTLRRYVHKRDHPGLLSLPFRKEAVQRGNVQRTVAQLDALDAQWRTLAKAETPAPPIAPGSSERNAGALAAGRRAPFSVLPQPSAPAIK